MDFLLLVLCAHVITAAKQYKNANDDDVIVVADKVVTKLVKISLSTRSDHDQMTVHNYATDLLTLTLVWHGFHDAIREAGFCYIGRFCCQFFSKKATIIM